MARALIFDFDGTILDTEGPVYFGWRDLYALHGVDLDLVTWQETIGTDRYSDHWANLVAIVGQLDPSLQDWPWARRDELLHAEVPRAGVLTWLDDAERLGVPVGIASSSPTEWVTHHLERLGLRDRFGYLACVSEAIPAKPDPTSYRHACEQLGADPTRSIAVEDSPHGVAAAKDAGLFVIATPHGLTASLDFSRADLVVASLDDVRLADVVVELRLARTDEGEWLYSLHRAAFGERVKELFGSWDEALQREHWAARDPRNVVEVVVVDGHRVGAVHTRVDVSLEVDLIELQPDHQGAGVGGAVLRALVERAGTRDVTLRTHRGNPALRLYLRLGFAIEGENETHHLLRRRSAASRM